MKVRNILLASAFAFAAVGATAARAQVKEVEMVHWWTSGGEAAALNVLKDNLQKQGYRLEGQPDRRRRRLAGHDRAARPRHRRQHPDRRADARLRHPGLGRAGRPRRS